ncbi:ABC transporter permease [Agrobacterium sp. SHOUNA12C]|uniref:Oligopeptide ABC transporter n=2 Tax=Rhizobium rhizogenes TaxID=359 RepID=B9JLK5_RHIR8|nr:ABC transporter permease [Rhizobium rhizogenes]ACM30741.1 oligopeptide ABC transporter [Rhizobium rhizogenes K84]KAA6488920.1 ABC transporter permease [Agrobacterium sp. ICMP 7243]MCJ9721077.1 ABC transporter permease [Agrobacterium sp. BETTINA12B]MCJ9755834.1 ABC transporter permease [Agrobacterium sp. SHOUNA12C]OCJ01476.1 peptide ABC transporter permease [Agrobacterium sp. 13-626]OCJ16080.1 peptide ABC transporter permease [Agrobacterium sp. B131/95]OCJ19188.1 peptide ABC transporter pe
MLARSPTRSPGPLARAFERFLFNRLALFGVCLIVPMLVLILSYPLWWSFKPNDIDLLAMNSGPTTKHWFGTDGVGRDVFARVLAGGRISLLVAIGSTAISAVIGFLVGAISALAGRFADAVTMRFVDLVMTLPPVIFLLVLASIAGTGIWPTVLVISLLSWPLLARMIRSRLLELRERDFVIAARGMGAGLPHLLLRHGLPNSIDILVVFATLQIANSILLEAGLSFLGLGIAPPAASWGNMLNAARSTAVFEQYPWQWLFPGGALVLAVLAINFIGDGLRDAFDPHTERN